MEIGRSAPRRLWTLALGPALGGLVLLAGPGDEPGVARMAAIAAWMAAWWISEAVPIAVTALLPLVLIPLAGINPVGAVAPDYSRSTVYLFLGGFLIALAMQVTGVHRRVALFVVHRVGSRPRRMVLGFMLATWALSMWIANTSTAMLMLPIALSVLATARDQGAPEEQVRALAVAILLGVAYAANMGGMVTLVGTPPNLAFSRIFVRQFPEAPEVGFLPWMLLAGPFSIVFLALGWLLLTRVVFRLPDVELLGGHDTVGGLRAALGPLRRDEKVAGLVFAATALLWMTGSGLDLGAVSLPGWRQLLGLEGIGGDADTAAAVAVAMGVVLFAVPSADRPGEGLLEWSMTKEVPWGMLLLFGGGFALASGFTASGLSEWAAGRLSVLRGVSPWVMVLLVSLSLTFLTELTSNLATTEMILPILAATATGLAIDPRLLMIPATLSASCAFMMPVATPPAAIVYASGQIPIRQMVRAGLLFNAVGVVLLLTTLYLLAGPVLGIDPAVMPEWAGP